MRLSQERRSWSLSRPAGPSARPLRPETKSWRFSIINRPSSIINSDGFTLIELLVVISIIALLMSILMPCLQRARTQARAIGCQANLRQWGILYATYEAENNGYLPSWDAHDPSWPNPADPWWSIHRWTWGLVHAPDSVEPGTPESASFTAVKDILCCPMAAKCGYPILDLYGFSDTPIRGGTFLAWTIWNVKYAPWWYWYSSYSTNHQAHSWPRNIPDPVDYWRLMWMTSAVKNASAVPAFLDSMSPSVSEADEKSSPPEYDAIPTRDLRLGSCWSGSTCLNRHNGGINSLFLDWSVHKVGLKELWTLKWDAEYNTAGPWTKAGGVRPEDWPAWMRRFKDY